MRVLHRAETSDAGFFLENQVKDHNRYGWKLDQTGSMVGSDSGYR
jgi:hypothetical protein